MIPVNYLILKDSIVVNHETRTLTVNKKEPAYDKALAIIRSGDLNELIALMDKSHVVENYIPDGVFVVQNGAVFSEGERVGGYIEERLIQFAEMGLPYEPLLNFWKRLRNNPSKNSCIQLYRFLEEAKCPLTQRGTFIAYKSVKRQADGTMVAHHDSNFVYVVGEPAAMDRAKVVDDPSHACGQGLHVGSYSYASGFGSGSSSIMLEMEVDPADVVSVPKDCASGKCRCCLITPIAVLEGGEYDTPIVLEDEGHTTDTAVVDSAVLTINRLPYESRAITSDIYKDLDNPNHNPPVRLRPSKAPKAIREFGTFTAGYRVADTDAVRYYMSTDDNKYYAFVPVGTNEETVPTADAAPNADISVIEIVKENASGDEIIAEVVFKRAKYVVKSITANKYEQGCAEGTNVRASKMPACVKDQGADVCFRIDKQGVTSFAFTKNSEYFAVVPK